MRPGNTKSLVLIAAISAMNFKRPRRQWNSMFPPGLRAARRNGPDRIVDVDFVPAGFQDLADPRRRQDDHLKRAGRHRILLAQARDELWALSNRAGPHDDFATGPAVLGTRDLGSPAMRRGSGRCASCSRRRNRGSLQSEREVSAPSSAAATISASGYPRRVLCRPHRPAAAKWIRHGRSGSAAIAADICRFATPILWS